MTEQQSADGPPLHIPAAKRAYLWVSPRGFSNEGTVYIIPIDQVDTALARLGELYTDDGNQHYTQLDGQEAYRRALKDHARWAHHDWWDRTIHGDAIDDTIAASRWLYQTETP